VKTSTDIEIEDLPKVKDQQLMAALNEAAFNAAALMKARRDLEAARAEIERLSKALSAPERNTSTGG
jgi:hypothetical protein